jgi:hypothetical protein
MRGLATAGMGFINPVVPRGDHPGAEFSGNLGYFSLPPHVVKSPLRNQQPSSSVSSRDLTQLPKAISFNCLSMLDLPIRTPPSAIACYDLRENCRRGRLYTTQKVVIISDEISRNGASPDCSRKF